MPEDYDVFAITVKKLSKSAKDLTQEDYQYYIDWVHKTYNDAKITQVYYEKDKQHQRLHFHGFIHLPINFYRKKLCKEDYNVYLKQVFNSFGWERYCMKDQKQDPTQSMSSSPMSSSPMSKQPMSSMFSKLKRSPTIREYVPTQDDLDDFDFYKSELYSYEYPSDEYIVDLHTPIPV